MAILRFTHRKTHRMVVQIYYEYLTYDFGEAKG